MRTIPLSAISAASSGGVHPAGSSREERRSRQFHNHLPRGFGRGDTSRRRSACLPARRGGAREARNRLPREARAEAQPRRVWLERSYRLHGRRKCPRGAPDFRRRPGEENTPDDGLHDPPGKRRRPVVFRQIRYNLPRHPRGVRGNRRVYRPQPHFLMKGKINGK